MPVPALTILKLKLKGGALYISILLSILISIILSLLLSLAYYTNRSIQSRLTLEQLQRTLQSGFEMANSNHYSFDKEVTWQKMPYNNDSLRIKKMLWGCYTLINITAKNTHFNFVKTGLFGCLSSKDTALLATEQNKPVIFSGFIKFNGTCYLPGSEIKTSIVDTNGRVDMEPLKPFIKRSDVSLPLIDVAYKKEIQKTQNKFNLLNDSLASSVPAQWDQLFQHKTLIVNDSCFFLTRQILSNNIKLVASDLVSIENTCQLSDILIVARKIIFKKGFRGKVHAIASDSIVIEENCLFDYPSSFCVNSTFKSTGPIPPTRGIFFDSDCTFKGALLAIKTGEGDSKMVIKVRKHFELTGNIYSSDNAGIQGRIYGTVLCKAFLFETYAGSYENYLVNCLVDPKKFAAGLIVPDWFSSTHKSNSCAKWL